VEPKEKMKLKTGRSPDLFDGLAVGVEGARRRGFAIAALANPRQKRNGREKDWRDELTQRAAALSKAPVLNHSA
jgi:hypothetical protein